MNLENIANWFLYKNLTQNQIYAYHTGEKEISKETEKAVLINVNSDFGSFSFWCPKSIVNNTYAVKEEVTYTTVTINGRQFAKEILIKNESKMAELGITKEELENMIA